MKVLSSQIYKLVSSDPITSGKVATTRIWVKRISVHCIQNTTTIQTKATRNIQSWNAALKINVDGLVHNYSISSASTIGILWFCTKPSIYENMSYKIIFFNPQTICSYKSSSTYQLTYLEILSVLLILFFCDMSDVKWDHVDHTRICFIFIILGLKPLYYLLHQVSHGIDCCINAYSQIPVPYLCWESSPMHLINIWSLFGWSILAVSNQLSLFSFFALTR